MVKKFLWSLSIVALVGLVNCGGGSSKEAKALLQKILQFVGISQTLIVNVCQDSNRDGMCNIGEIQAKVTINKGDSVDDIWRKIALNSEGQYFLETYNPESPILLELQDTSKVDFDDGKFTLAFDGFQTNEQNETKEISVLESMVDADAISKAEADSFRTLTNAEAQEKFYTTLLDDLETNINTLRRDGLDSKTAVTATIKEMGDETKANQESADRINSCGDDQSCIDNEIKKVSDELIITEEEANILLDNNSSDTNNTNSSNNTNNSDNKWIVPNGVMKDEVSEKQMFGNYEGEIIPEFIDLSELEVEVTDTNILVKITLLNLPQKLIYNRDSNNSTEYEWIIDFLINDDVNNKETVWFGVAIAGLHPDEGEKIGITSDIIYTIGHYRLFNINIKNNTIIFNIPKSLDSNLEKITSETKVQFRASHTDNGNDHYYDEYPN
jgi:hypothetical protein